jgi:hypothetical protein
MIFKSVVFQFSSRINLGQNSLPFSHKPFWAWGNQTKQNNCFICFLFDFGPEATKNSKKGGGWQNSVLRMHFLHFRVTHPPLKFGNSVSDTDVGSVEIKRPRTGETKTYEIGEVCKLSSPCRGARIFLLNKTPSLSPMGLDIGPTGLPRKPIPRSHSNSCRSGPKGLNFYYWFYACNIFHQNFRPG